MPITIDFVTKWRPGDPQTAPGGAGDIGIFQTQTTNGVVVAAPGSTPFGNDYGTGQFPPANPLFPDAYVKRYVMDRDSPTPIGARTEDSHSGTWSWNQPNHAFVITDFYFPSDMFYEGTHDGSWLFLLQQHEGAGDGSGPILAFRLDPPTNNAPWPPAVGANWLFRATKKKATGTPQQRENKTLIANVQANTWYTIGYDFWLSDDNQGYWRFWQWNGTIWVPLTDWLNERTSYSTNNTYQKQGVYTGLNNTSVKLYTGVRAHGRSADRLYDGLTGLNELLTALGSGSPPPPEEPPPPPPTAPLVRTYPGVETTVPATSLSTNILVDENATLAVTVFWRGNNMPPGTLTWGGVPLVIQNIEGRTHLVEDHPGPNDMNMSVWVGYGIGTGTTQELLWTPAVQVLTAAMMPVSHRAIITGSLVAHAYDQENTGTNANANSGPMTTPLQTDQWLLGFMGATSPVEDGDPVWIGDITITGPSIVSDNPISRASVGYVEIDTSGTFSARANMSTGRSWLCVGLIFEAYDPADPPPEGGEGPPVELVVPGTGRHRGLRQAFKGVVR
jgi:hypothetical protein